MTHVEINMVLLYTIFYTLENIMHDIIKPEPFWKTLIICTLTAAVFVGFAAITVVLLLLL